MQQNKLITQLQQLVPEKVVFEPGKVYYWSPQDNHVFYQPSDNSEVGLWTLLHETSHALLQHQTYQSDFELVQLEVAAWEEAKRLGTQLKLSIDDNHVQDCLDSYRDWQYRRSLCPRCDLGGIQTDNRTYTCLFCDGTWHVSTARFCRPYRRKT